MTRKLTAVTLAGVAILVSLSFGAALGSNRVAPNEWRELADPLVVAVNTDGVHFAASYVSPDHSRLVILYVGDEREAKARVASVLSDDVPVEWRQVEHNYAELKLIQMELVEMWKSDLDRIEGVSVDIPNNRVVVEVTLPDPALEQMVAEKYGAVVAFEIVPEAKNLLEAY